MTNEELLAEVEAAYRTLENPEGFYTRQEWDDLLGLESQSTLKRLRLLKRVGRLEVREIMRENLRGKLVPTPAYRLTE